MTSKKESTATLPPFPKHVDWWKAKEAYEAWRGVMTQRLQEMLAKAEQEQFILQGDKEAASFYRGFIQGIKALLATLDS